MIVLSPFSIIHDSSRKTSGSLKLYLTYTLGVCGTELPIVMWYWVLQGPIGLMASIFGVNGITCTLGELSFCDPLMFKGDSLYLSRIASFG